MQIVVGQEPKTVTTITIKGHRNKRERLKIVFDDGAELLFKLEQHLHSRGRFVLDVENTDTALVDEILSSRLERRVADEGFDVFSVITPEQYRQLITIYFEPEREEESPQVGEELSAWIGARLGSSGASGGSIREGRLIAEITAVLIDPKAPTNSQTA